MRRRVLFLPGASGVGEFWQPVADLLPESFETVLFDWPGFGNVPADAGVHSLADLIDLVLSAIDEPVDIVAQSMGGVVAIQTALARPDAVRSLVLVATSGGIDLSQFDVEDWRPTYRAEFPRAQPFVTQQQQVDLSDQLATIQTRTLLVWSRGDRISPPEVGQYLASKLPRARLVILNYADHMFARDHADEVAPLILDHLERGLAPR
jgi:pimeloyl-ACP methyl ester carboxylesterase